MVPFPFSLKSLHFNLEEHPECKIIDRMRRFRNKVGFIKFPIERFGKLNLCQILICGQWPESIDPFPVISRFPIRSKEDSVIHLELFNCTENRAITCFCHCRLKRESFALFLTERGFSLSSDRISGNFLDFHPGLMHQFKMFQDGHSKNRIFRKSTWMATRPLLHP